MSQDFGIHATTPGVVSTTPAATDSAAARSATPAGAGTGVGKPDAPSRPLDSGTTFISTPATDVNAPSRKVANLLKDPSARVIAPGLVKVSVANVPDRGRSKKEVPALATPRIVDGSSPYAPAALAAAGTGKGLLSVTPRADGESVPVASANDGVQLLPGQNGLETITQTPRGLVYMTDARWDHIDKAHIGSDAVTQRGKASTSYWPVEQAVHAPTMTRSDVRSVIVDAAREGDISLEVRDTRRFDYELPKDQKERYGVDKVMVSVAPDGQLLSSYPISGPNVLAVKEVTPEEQAQFSQLVAQRDAQRANDGRMFQTRVAPTTFG